MRVVVNQITLESSMFVQTPNSTDERGRGRQTKTDCRLIYDLF